MEKPMVNYLSYSTSAASEFYQTPTPDQNSLGALLKNNVLIITPDHELQHKPAKSDMKPLEMEIK